MGVYAIAFDLDLTAIANIEASDHYEAMDIAEQLLKTDYKQEILREYIQALDLNPYIEIDYVGEAAVPTITTDEIKQYYLKED